MTLSHPALRTRRRNSPYGHRGGKQTVSLLQQLRERSRDALASGALQPIETDARVVEDGGISFVVRVLGNLKRKAAAAQSARDPFLPPYEPDLYVGEVAATHVALLNKYNVLPHHLLLVTRDYEPQTQLLNRGDLAALLWALSQVDGLGFYNGGAEAGASQTHKHLQLVPRPLADVGPPVPFEPWFERHAPQRLCAAVPGLAFRHAVTPVPGHWWQTPQRAADAAYKTYRALLSACALGSDGPVQSAPYNLLLTRRWMWLVARSCEAYADIPVNALGFAGALLVNSEARLATLAGLGPMRVLAGVGMPPL